MNNQNFEITKDEVLRENYAELVKAVTEFNSNEKNKDKQLTICPAMAGSETAKIMIVGRAINGWCSIKQVCKESTKSIEEQTLEMVNRCGKCNLDWVVGENYYTKCIDNHCRYAQEQYKKNKDRDKKKSAYQRYAFWQFAKLIVKKYFKDNKKEFIKGEWQKEIIWTNLYKASYEDGKNPKGFYEAQKSMCDKILKMEIELYQPEAIFFITEKNYKADKEKFGFSWFVEKDFPYTYDLIKGNNLKSEVFVTKRPERRKIEEVYGKKVQLK